MLMPASQVCEALHYLHESKGIAHRDIKPHNVLIVRPLSSGGTLSADASSSGGPNGDLEAGASQKPARPSSGTGAYSAMLMDFGSAASRHVTPATRREALALQEEAEALCTATYRAPELFDVPTGLPLDFAKCDVWAAGCLLYAGMYGASPFQHAVEQTGGSIALATLNCSLPWPRTGEPRWGHSR